MTSVLWIAAGLALLTLGAEWLVRGAAKLAEAVGLPSLIIGLTVVAYGTSAPEFAVSVKSALVGQADIAVGNVVGSNTFNVLFILGVSALITPLTVSSQLVRLDVPVMIGASGLVWFLAAGGTVHRSEGMLLLAMILGYTVLLIRLGFRNPPQAGIPAPSKPPSKQRLAVSILLVIVGLVLLVLGARWLVQGATELARRLGVGELLIGLTLVAGGTSLPEAATSIVAGLRGQRDIAVGNIVGSNIFNLLAVLGAASAVSPNGVRISPAALHFDIPVMVAVAAACLPVFFTGGRVSRWEGAMFLGYYGAYLAFLLLYVSRSAALPAFSLAMVAFVLPGTILGLGASVRQALRRATPKHDGIP
ncbi:MAG: calcium/sodium antiporter [Phycisphaerae bacterium]|nr:calcium/sodium antiporter [Phycisphaerae bacterium]